MMRYVIFYIFVLMFASSCSVRRFLPPGEKLYRGATIHITKDSATKNTKGQLEDMLKLAASPTPNKFILGQPYKVWLWYVIGQPKREKGFKAFLRNKLGEPPVLSSRVNAKSTAENMQSLMENLGYFHSTVAGDTSTSGYFIKGIYDAHIDPQYHLRKVEWVSDSSAIVKLLERNSTRRGFLKSGNSYRLSDITAERDRLDLFLKTRGYYYFNPDYLMAYADSTVGDRKVDLLLNLKKSAPKEARHPYTINKIVIFPNYTLASPELDTSKTNLEAYDGLLIRDDEKKFKSKLFANTITYRPGGLYNSRSQNTSLNRLINLGAFKFVKNRFEAVKDSTGSDTAHRMNVYYYLTPAKKKSAQAEIDGFKKENGYIGSQVGVNWKNRNTFGGAEQLGVKVYGGFETTRTDSVKNNNYRLGSEITLKIPRYAIPFLHIKENYFYPPNTSLLVGYEWYRRDLFYTKNLFRFQYDFTWKTDIQNQFTFAPFALSYLKATNVTDSFLKQTLVDPSLLLNVYSEAILGTLFTYTYNSGFRSRKNKWYLSSGVDLSGNIAGLITGAKTFREKTIFGTPFAQYAKFDFDLHYTRKLPKNYEWANRISLGVGLPYNNSKILPFTKLYTIGGASSIRGFRSFTLGPGTYKTTPQDQNFFQIIGGDFKLLANSELRIPFTKQLSGALFVDAGNIWTKDTLLFGPKAQLTKNFYKEIAVGSGIGVRFDATVLLIRLDLGIPLRKPYLPDGQRWVLNQFDFGSKSWRRENLILNIAIGLPF
ncbi:MAG: BamA/TamA family outer membrane protein [Ferruginibacter sp.]